MTTYSEAIAALDDRGAVVLQSRSGKQYITYREILETAHDDVNRNGYDNHLIYGYILNSHPRCKNSYKWFTLENMTIVKSPNP